MEKWGPAGGGAVWFQVKKVRGHTQEGWKGAAVSLSLSLSLSLSHTQPEDGGLQGNAWFLLMPTTQTCSVHHYDAARLSP